MFWMPAISQSWICTRHNLCQRPLEAVLRRGVGKTDFGHVLPALPIASRGEAVGLGARLLQQLVMFVSMNRAPELLDTGALPT
jgi:hypothetical protein